MSIAATWAQHVEVKGPSLIVDMRCQSLSDRDMTSWCSWFTDYCGTLRLNRVHFKVVDFSMNRLTSTGVQKLLHTLTSMSSYVDTLILHHNKIETASEISGFLRRSKGRLRQLHLSDNELSTAGVIDIIATAVSITSAGSPCYPINGKMPLWLRVEQNRYDSRKLEVQLQEALGEDRPLHKILCNVVIRPNSTCRSHVCQKSPAPAVHATHLFTHWQEQTPSHVCQTDKTRRTNWPPLVRDATGKFMVKMSGLGLKDNQVSAWCGWFKRELGQKSAKSALILFKEVDFANNWLSEVGLTQLLKCLISCNVQMDFIKLRDNACEHGQDVDFTLYNGTLSCRESLQCPARISGCLCGGDCRKLDTQEAFEDHWAQLTDTRFCKWQDKRLFVVRMNDKGIDDVAMGYWCAWFQCQQRKLTHGCSLMEVDFSSNYVTKAGVHQLLTTLTSAPIEVGVLKLHRNEIELEEGGEFMGFLERNRGKLRELHLSGNRLGTRAAGDIVKKVVSLSLRSLGRPCYPIDGQVPLWLRLENNSYNSEELEDNLRKALRETLDSKICIKTHSSECRPWQCFRLSPAPAIHAPYLFRHRERMAEAAQHQTAPAASNSLKVRRRDFEKALHQLQSQQQQLKLRVFQPHQRPVANAPERLEEHLAPRPPMCSGHPRIIKFMNLNAMASASSKDGAPECFLPHTRFLLAGGSKFVTAAELCGNGGASLVGPNDSTVVVLRTSKLKKEKRELAYIHAAHSDGAFVVTADHRLLVEGPAGQTEAEARIVVQEFSRGSHWATSVYDGSCFHAVKNAFLYDKETEVVQVFIQGDESALMWIRPRHQRSKSAHPANRHYAIAVKGEHLDPVRDRGVAVSRTFITPIEADPAVQSLSRSRSEGSLPNPSSLWSKGTIEHPDHCRICHRHHRFLLDQESPNKANATPCPHGASCRFCHARHSDVSRLRHT